MLDKALINQWKTMSNQETAQNDIDNSLGNQEKETIQEQIKEPEYDNTIIEILRGQIERLEKQTDIKDAQISDLSHTNKELLERLKEVNYTLGNVQKQLNAPTEPPRKWWHIFLKYQ
jgi:chromosome segregation ATPase